MLMNLIMFITMYPTALLLFFILKYMGKNHGRYVFGVTLTKEQKESEEIQEITRCYEKQMLRWFLGMCWVPALSFLTEYVSIQFTIWMAWFFGILAVLMMPYMIANKKALKLKDVSGSDEEPIVYYELKEVRTLHWTTFIGPILLSVVPTIFLFFADKIINLDPSMQAQLGVYQWIMVTFAVMTLFFVWIACWMDNRKTLVISGDSTLNVNYARAKKQMWKKVWLGISWVNAILIVLLVAVYLMNWHMFPGFMDGTILETFFIFFIIVKASIEQNKIDKLYEEKFSLHPSSDEDRFWKWGIFYYNKSDKHTMVEKRYGMGTSVNMASKGGKACMAFVVASLVWIPFFCIYMILADFTPLQIRVEENTVICKHVKVDYRIEGDEIVHVELMNELPKSRIKNAGTNSDTFEKGSFSNASLGKFQEFLKPHNSAYIYIETEKKNYLISAETDAWTIDAYEKICEIVK